MNSFTRSSEVFLIDARMPWSESPSSRDHGMAKGDGGLKHRGWTLVNVFRWRYAVNDETGERIRVCHESTNSADALRAFRLRVDEREDA